MNFLLKFIVRVIVKTIGSDAAKKLILEIAKYARLDLLHVAYNNLGILKCENNIVSGEHFLATKVLKKNLCNIETPVMFDVGANVGKYSRMLAKEFPSARIYAFEPNINTYKQLVDNVGDVGKCYNVGMGEEQKAEKIFTYSDSLASSHASIYGDVFRTFHKRDDIVGIDFQLTSLDLFCEMEKITKIDFLKIDTEGNELNVLKGAEQILADGKIKIIQFEFGECDVFSRVFLRDFYEILSAYKMYRLDSNRLIPLFAYESTNEIFRFQNFIAVRNDFAFHEGL
ncbi:FkbM family methyltransferase [Deltaproteobacteria bacterium IMCC39524]|nr:FkbM family methyltransferase [Deltaproteobacteria bacterium IMCC39524]